MKVLFITPPFHAGVVEVAGRWVPLYFVYLAGSLKATGHEAHIYDAMTKFVGYDEIEARIRELKPDIVATTAITCTSIDAGEICALAKRIDPKITTICGGIHASFMYQEMFSLYPALDYIVVGEGEITIAELVDAIENKRPVKEVLGVAYREGEDVTFTGVRPYMDDLNNLPTAWEELDWNDYTYFIMPGSRLAAIDTSRGCDKDCTFCSQQKFWKQTWRARTPEDLVREITMLNTTYKVDVILLTDDYPTPDRARWEKFLDMLIEANLPVKFLMETRVQDIIRDREILWKYHKAGIIHIYVGTESVDQSALDSIKKDITLEECVEAIDLLREHNIITETSMILGFPDDTVESIERTIELSKELNPDFAHYLAIAPWPYSNMYEEMKPYIAVTDYRKYNLIDPIIKPKAMTLEEVDRQIVNGYRDFYMSKFMSLMQGDDQFRKDYLMRAMKLMMSTSFIKKKLGMMGGEMPEEIKAIMSSQMG